MIIYMGHFPSLTVPSSCTPNTSLREIPSPPESTSTNECVYTVKAIHKQTQYSNPMQCKYYVSIYFHSLLSTHEPITAPWPSLRFIRTPNPNQHAWVVGAEEGWNVDGTMNSTVESPPRPGALLVIAC